MVGMETHIWLSGVRQMPATAESDALAEQIAGELVESLAERHPALADHLERSADLSAQVALELGLDADHLWRVSYAARLHDIGKVAVPGRVLNKPGPLEAAEWATIHRHTVVGARILQAFSALSPVARIVRASHERFDGEGYPDRLAGEAIPLEARIVFTCDAFDAMTSDRPYQRAIGIRKAMLELQRCAGTQFDPRVVDALGHLIPVAA